MLEHPDNGGARSSSAVHSRIHESRLSSSFLASAFPRMLIELRSISRSRFHQFPFTARAARASTAIHARLAREPAGLLRNGFTRERDSSHRFSFPLCSLPPFTVGSSFVDLTPYNTPYTDPRTLRRASVCRGTHGGTFHLYTRARTTAHGHARVRRTHAHTHTYRRARARTCAPVHRYTRVRAGARARIRSRDGRSGTDARATTSCALQRPPAAQRRKVYAPSEGCARPRRSAAAAVAAAAAAAVAAAAAAATVAAARRRALYRMENARTGFGPPRRRTDIPGSVNRLNCARLTPRVHETLQPRMTDAHPPATDRTAAALRIPTRGHTRHQNSPHGEEGERGGRRRNGRKEESSPRVVASGTLTSARLSRIIARVSRASRGQRRIVRVRENKRGRREAYVTR